MANSKHLEILMEGVDSWNKWFYIERGAHYGRRDVPDLSNWDGAFLREFDLQRLFKSYGAFDFEIKQLFDDHNAGKLSFELQTEGWKTLNEINFEGANLAGIDLNYISLWNANLSFSNLSFSNLESASLYNSNLRGADLSNSLLNSSSFRETSLNDAKLISASMISADFQGANLTGADLSNANLDSANLSGANLTGANLSAVNLDSANLRGANLTKAILSGASLCNADLQGAILVETNLEKANLSGSRIYGISTWNLQLTNSIQTDLIISSDNEATITLDNLEVAQFLYLLLKNEKIRDVIDTLTSKVVLILGRFTEERKVILDMLRDELRQRNYLPILFDFEKPASRDLTETISTISHMSRFIIADLTDAKSIPQELLQIIPDLPSVPVQPILLASQREYAMFEHFRRYPWVLNTYFYNNSQELLNNLSIEVIEPAEAKVLQMKPGNY